MLGKYPPLVIILGPTAIGKTDFAITLAQQLNGEIVGADSRQIYRWMDIGTAKPTTTQQAMIKHHLIDIVDPDENLSLAEYQEQAYNTIKTISESGKIPFLVGGTGQYLTALEEGWSIPKVPPNHPLRDQLEAEAEAIGYEAFHAKLQAIDPIAAQTIHPNNVRRVIRALEVYYETGIPITVLQEKKPPPYRIRVLGLKMERVALYERADRRVDMMIEQGFVEEVQDLLEKGYAAQLPAMSALGYRYIARYCQGQISLDEAITLTKNSTHDFIRRQEIWFRGHDNGSLWHNVAELDIDQIQRDLSKWIEE